MGDATGDYGQCVEGGADETRFGVAGPAPLHVDHLSTEPLDLGAERRVMGRVTLLPPDIEERDLEVDVGLLRFHPCRRTGRTCPVGSLHDARGLSASRKRRRRARLR